MYMKIPIQRARNGYALITVLFSLAILTVLIGSASRLAINHAMVLKGQAVLSSRLTLTKSLLYLAVSKRQGQENSSHIRMVFKGSNYTAIFQDVGGLVDLNTASPDLLSTVLENLGARDPSDIIEKLRAWRRQGYRLLRSEDFARITGLSSAVMRPLSQITTVFSGRRGISPDVAPGTILEILASETGSPEYLASRIPPTYISPASGVNFRVIIQNEDGSMLGSMVIHLPPEFSDIRILSFD